MKHEAEFEIFGRLFNCDLEQERGPDWAVRFVEIHEILEGADKKPFYGPPEPKLSTLEKTAVEAVAEQVLLDRMEADAERADEMRWDR